MKVSACIITYNQEDYIRECLQGAIEQVIDCEYEIVIGEDCSTDATLRICQEYAIRYPNLIRLLPNNGNLGMMKNWQRTIKECQGDYIAICEGDDYWKDPLKLQKQVSFFEASPNFSVCFHKVDIKYGENIKPFLEDINIDTPEDTSIQDIVIKNYIHTPSVMYRNFRDFPEWLNTAFPNDWPMHIIAATHGKIKMLPEIMAVYRVHEDGVYSMKVKSFEKEESTMINLQKELHVRGFFSESGFLLKRNNERFVVEYGFKGKNNRLGRSLLILKKGTWKMRLFFFLPLLFSNSYRVYLNIVEFLLNLKYKIIKNGN